MGNGGRGRGNDAPNKGNNSSRHFSSTCQVCFKEGHSVVQCWHQFDPDYVPDERHVNAAGNSYDVNTNWYTDTGSTDHITSNLDKLNVHDKYTGSDQILIASGAGMNINRIGHATVHSSRRTLHINNVLHVPQASKILFSFIVLLLTIKPFLSFILIFSW